MTAFRLAICFLLYCVSLAGAAHAQDVFGASDAVEFEWFINPDFNASISDSISDLDNFFYSPDGKKALFVTRKGNVSSSTVQYRLHLVTISGDHRTDEIQSVCVAKFETTSNRSGISSIRWLSDERIAFLGEKVGGFPEIYVLELGEQPVRLTVDAREKLGFDVNDNGEAIYGTPQSVGLSKDEQQNGYYFSDQTLSDVLGIEKDHWRRPTSYQFISGGQRSEIKSLRTPTSAFPPFVSISPTGNYAVISSAPNQTPKHWGELPLEYEAVAGKPTLSVHQELYLIDLESDKATQLTGGPMVRPFSRNQVLWDETYDRLFLLDQFVSNETALALGVEAAQYDPMVFEYSLSERRPARLIDIAERVRRGEEDREAILQAVVSRDGRLLTIHRQERSDYFRMVDSQWKKNHGSEVYSIQSSRPFELIIDQTVSTLPVMKVRFPSGEKKMVTPLLNEQVRHKLAKTEIIQWVDRDGREWVGGLTTPKQSTGADGLPLVIQSHQFSEHEFLLTGPGGSYAGFSAQGLAAAGFAVLTMGREKTTPLQSEEEFVRSTEGFRSAVETLSSRGLIDEQRVGIITWSRSGFWLQHALAFEPNLFTAAITTDSSSFGSFLYLYFENWTPGYQATYHTQNGGPPFGALLDQWRQNDPVQKVDSFTIPIRIERYGEGIPSWWEPYAAMKRAGQPVEYFHLPSAVHNPVQAHHQYAIQNATIDWFKFWLLGEQSDEAAKREQYARWRMLRDNKCQRSDSKHFFYCERRE